MSFNIDQKKVPFYISVLVVLIGFAGFMLWLKILPHQTTLIVPGDGTYTGSIVDGRFEGKGTFASVSGVKYVGEWHNGQYEGEGTITFADGSTYSGQWKDGEMNGTGKFTNKSGTTLIQEWDDGHLISEHS